MAKERRETRHCAARPQSLDAGRLVVPPYYEKARGEPPGVAHGRPLCHWFGPNCTPPMNQSRMADVLVVGMGIGSAALVGWSAHAAGSDAAHVVFVAAGAVLMPAIPRPDIHRIHPRR